MVTPPAPGRYRVRQNATFRAGDGEYRSDLKAGTVVEVTPGTELVKPEGDIIVTCVGGCNGGCDGHDIDPACLEPIDDVDDPDVWYDCNPALGIRISEGLLRDPLGVLAADPAGPPVDGDLEALPAVLAEGATVPCGQCGQAPDGNGWGENGCVACQPDRWRLAQDLTAGDVVVTFYGGRAIGLAGVVHTDSCTVALTTAGQSERWHHGTPVRLASVAERDAEQARALREQVAQSLHRLARHIVDSDVPLSPDLCLVDVPVATEAALRRLAQEGWTGGEQLLAEGPLLAVPVDLPGVRATLWTTIATP